MDWCPLEDRSIIFAHFGELRKKWPKNAQKSQKSSKIAIFRLLKNGKPKKSTANTAIVNPSMGGLENYTRTSVSIYKWPPHKITTS